MNSIKNMTIVIDGTVNGFITSFVKYCHSIFLTALALGFEKDGMFFECVMVHCVVPYCTMSCRMFVLCHSQLYCVSCCHCYLQYLKMYSCKLCQ